MSDFGGVTQMFGGLLGTAGTLRKNSETAFDSRINAGLAERDAQFARDQGAAAVLQERRRGYMALSSMRAGFGASGITADGSALDVLQASAGQAALNVQNINYKTNLKVLGYQDTANADLRKADNIDDNYWLTFLGGALGASGGAVDSSSSRGTGTPIPGSSGDYSDRSSNYNYGVE